MLPDAPEDGPETMLEEDQFREAVADAIASLSVEDARNPSHLYARVLRKAIGLQLPLDDFHLSDVLIALREAGYTIEAKTGLLLGQRKAA